MVVTPEQSRIVQEFLFKNEILWAGYSDTKRYHATYNNKLHVDGKVLYSDWNGTRGIPEETFEQFQEKYMKESLNTQIGGSHYQDFPIQPIEFIMKNSLSFPVGNIIKYVCRFDKKNGLEDLNKAKHYLEILIENYDTNK